MLFRSLSGEVIRFGRPVTVILDDPDLNTNHGTIDIYSTIDDPNSSNVDTVGDNNGGILLEVLIKNIRYKRCTINGIETGGLASTGFSLIETGPDTGKFTGSFKMPSQICNDQGTALISPAGGIVDLKYHDFRDFLGQSNIFTLSKNPIKEKLSVPSPVKINSKSFILPTTGKTTDVLISGKAQKIGRAHV